MMKQMICLVNDEEKKVLSKHFFLTIDIIFTNDINEFSSKLTNNSIQIISLNCINRNNSTEISDVIRKHSDKNFYILDKKNRIVENYEFDILTSENILASLYSISEIFELC